MKRKLFTRQTWLLLFGFLLYLSPAWSKQLQTPAQIVAGTVFDEQGNPLIGATVLEVGTTNGALTDAKGAFRLSVKDDQAVLKISYLDYETQEVPVGNNATLNIKMKLGGLNLDEVVVIGYGSQRKGDLTGAISSAPLGNFTEAPNTNILQSLSGSTPGINIGQVTGAGEEPSIRIRGQSSLNGSQNPLIILDGVYYRGRLTDLNPKDIQSVNVLKDPSSKAIYGAQAANGVVIVTTKSGKSASKPVISYSTYLANQTPAIRLTPKGRDEYLKSVRDVDWKNGYLGPDYLQENPNWTIANNTALFPPLLAGFANGTNYNWYDDITSPGYITDHQLSVRGRSDNTSYFVSGGYTDQKGWMLNDTYKRVTSRINLDIDVTDWLTLGTNTFGSFSDYSGQSPSLPQIQQMSPLASPRNANGDFIINPLGDFVVNPYLNSEADDRDLRNNLSGIFYANVKIPFIKGLNYRLNFSNNYRWDAYSNSNPYGAGLSGSAIKSNSATYDLLLDNIVSYDRQLNENHRIGATFLYGFNKIRYDQTTARGSNFSNLTLGYNNLGQAIIPVIGSAAWSENYLYQMGRINYDFKGRYLLTATVRRDGFSGFAQNNKFGVFPSLGAGWVISEEGFLREFKAINFLKLRASYGLNGNLTNRYSSLARVSSLPASQYVFEDGGTTVNGQQLASLANPNLSWERTAGINVGLDFAALNNRVSGSLDFYQSRTTDLLWNYILPQITGFSSITSNVGEISNRGVELQLDVNPIKSAKFSWDLSFNLAANDNRVVSLLGLDKNGDGKEDDLIANRLFIDESIGTIYDYVVEGIWQISDEGNIPTGWFPGQYKLQDLNEDAKITAESDRRILGRTEPAYQFGVQNTLNYGDFTLKIFVRSIQGGKNGYLGINDPFAGSDYGSIGNAQSRNWFSQVDYWSPSNPNATYRLPGPGASIGGQRYFDRSFVRLQDISLSYQLSDVITRRVGIRSLKLFVSGKNLLTFTNWEGWDPETGQGLGVTANRSLPVMKGYTVGLDISL